MSISPILTFKAGRCDIDTTSKPPKIKCLPDPGYIYLFTGDEELIHFCWRPRSAPASSPTLDLLMIPTDGSFIPYTGAEQPSSSDDVRSPTNGRIFVLKFNSSSQRHLFWLQSKSQHPTGDANWFSARDLKIGQVVDMLLAGEEIDVQDELRDVQNAGGGAGGSRPDGDGDEPMEDVVPGGEGSGGAGADATGGDVREEGEEAREGGADGGRAASGSAPTDATTLVQNFLNSLQSGNTSTQSRAQQQQDPPFATLPDLLPPSTTIPIIDSAPSSLIDSLLSHLPPTILLLAQEADDASTVDPNSETASAAIEALSLPQKRDILRRVLRSPQMTQSLASLTMALREGGLPSIGEALRLRVENGGLLKGGAVPVGGDRAVEVFLEGVRRTVEEEGKEEGEGRMETD
ncbi:hypothetical protein W97_00341 [Coniosporium apollinis CBS 100218]|uniref:Pru domain-containing protein n=1 Tax=Coniosporium apollinis (strain CBS 100218) TaxID=1168221 RepID=R7YGV9_CONA1|nr:uncharacterized protein W97_00341 [Coniosporium apollinis CBS 100218]EON61130.1 hypothetical protein W97_00341 [Coniosporium apollinis CBS 100218]